MPSQRVKIIIVGILIGIMIGATTLMVCSWDNIVRHQIPDEWIQIRGPTDTGPEWSRVKGVWAGFNGLHLFLKIEWNFSMEMVSHKYCTDYYGNNISAYFSTRGVDVEMVIGVIEASVRVRQLKNAYITQSRGVEAIARIPLVSDETTKEIIIEVPLPPLSASHSWPDFVQWHNVTSYFQFVSHASTEHLSALPKNSTHLITPDGEPIDWTGISSLPITAGIHPTVNDFGAITNISALFYSDGLAFMMSTQTAFYNLLTTYPNMNLEAYIFMGIEAFQEEPQLTEQSYNPNLYWRCIDGYVTRSNIVYHLWDAPTSSSASFNEETFEINNNQWNLSTTAELTLTTNQIQPLLTLIPTDNYSVHYSLILTYYTSIT